MRASDLHNRLRWAGCVHSYQWTDHESDAGEDRRLLLLGEGRRVRFGEMARERFLPVDIGGGELARRREHDGQRLRKGQLQRTDTPPGATTAPSRLIAGVAIAIQT